jgi:hypothetical protein
VTDTRSLAGADPLAVATEPAKTAFDGSRVGGEASDVVLAGVRTTTGETAGTASGPISVVVPVAFVLAVAILLLFVRRREG